MQCLMYAKWAARLLRATNAPKGELDGDDERHAAWIIARKLHYYMLYENQKRYPSVVPTPKEGQDLIDRCEDRAQREVRTAKEMGGAAALRMLLLLYSQNKKYEGHRKSEDDGDKANGQEDHSHAQKE